MSAAQIETPARQMFVQLAWLLTGAGTVMPFASVGLTVFALTVSDASDLFDGFFAIAVTGSFMISFPVGALGSHLLSMRQRADSTTSDTPHLLTSHQSLLEYSSAALWLVSLVFYGFVATLEYTIASQAPNVTFNALGMGRVWPATAIGATEALVTLAIPLIAMICAQLIARLPTPRLEQGASTPEFLPAFRTLGSGIVSFLEAMRTQAIPGLPPILLNPGK
jgi:hypothetical protein